MGVYLGEAEGGRRERLVCLKYIVCVQEILKE